MENNKKDILKRFTRYIIGLFIMTIGIAVSVKSDLGVSPVSSIPYTMTRCWNIEMGKATICFQSFLVLIQLCILRKKFKIRALLQVPVGILFGYFVTFSNYLISFLPDIDNYVIRIMMIFVSILIIATGLFFYVPANIMPLASEGVMQAVSDTTGIAFSKIKTAFDVTVVLISLILCLVITKSLGSVGIGTVLVALFVGTVLGWIMKTWSAFKKKRT